MKIFSSISKIISRIYGFLLWNWNYLFQLKDEDTDPTVQTLIQLIKSANHEDVIQEIESCRQKLINKNIDLPPHLLDKHDNQEVMNKISQHAVSSASPQLNAIIIRALVQCMDITHILELGTSVGISSAYMGYKQRAIIDTVDKDKYLSLAAKQWHNKIGITNINYYQGSFDTCLPNLLANNKYYDLIFIDGDHSYNGTIQNFNNILVNCSPNAIFIIDDIYWSWGMQKAWIEIRQHTAVKFNIDLYHFGIILLGNTNEKRTDYYQIPNLYRDWFLRKNI